MPSSTVYCLQELAEQLNAKFHGDGSCRVDHAAPLASAGAGAISFLDESKHRKFMQRTNASVVIVRPADVDLCKSNALLMDNPKLGFAKVLELLYPMQRPKPGIHSSAIIGEGCQIDDTVTIGPYVVIGDHASIAANTIIEAGVKIGSGTCIGTDCHIYPNVVLYHEVKIGDRVILHSGVVIGADGFGFAHEQGQWIKIPQIGSVVIGNDVEVGVNTAIDRGSLEDTVIGNGVKLDDQVMIGHNVQLGDHSIMAGCAGIAGSTRVGKHCMIGGGCCVNGHIELTDGVMLTGMCMVPKSLTKPGIYSSGTGLQKNQEWHRSVVRFHQLDAIANRLKRLEKIYDEQNVD